MTGCAFGAKNLTREKAAAMLLDYCNTGGRHIFDSSAHHCPANTATEFGRINSEIPIYKRVSKVDSYSSAERERANEQHEQLEKEGYIKIESISGEYGSDGNQDFFANPRITFTEKAAPYLVEEESDGKRWIALVKLISIDVNGITETSDTKRSVEFTAHYELTPFGKDLYSREKPKHVWKRLFCAL